MGSRIWKSAHRMSSKREVKHNLNIVIEVYIASIEESRRDMSSRSRQGETLKTTGFINNDSSKYVARTSLGHTKRGTEGETDAAHIFGFGLANTILTNSRGRPMSESTRQEFIRDMNDSSNMRIKTTYGNRVLDERRDARISHAYVKKEAIHGNTTGMRAYQAYQSASQYTTTDSLANELGNMRIYDKTTKRSHLVKNHGNYL